MTKNIQHIIFKIYLVFKVSGEFNYPGEQKIRAKVARSVE